MELRMYDMIMVKDGTRNVATVELVKNIRLLILIKYLHYKNLADMYINYI